MATLTTSYQLLAEQYIGNSYGNLYVRIYAKYSEQDIANNRTKVQYQARTYFEGNYIYDGSGAITVSGTSATSQTVDAKRPTNGDIAWVTTEAWVGHNSDGSKSISASAYLNFPNWGWSGTASATASLPTIPRQATLTSAPNFNDEESPTINYSNPAGNAVTSLKACISLTGSKDDIAYRDISKTGTSYKFNLTEAERNVLRNACTTANSRNVTFYVTTVIGGVTYYSTLTKTLTIVNANPVISASVVDNGSVSTTLTGNINKMIKGYNAMKASMNASGLKGASIKSYSITNGSKTINSSSASFSYTDNNTFVFKVTDSRGKSTSKTVTVPMVNYIKLTCNLAANNPTTDGNMSFSVRGNYFRGSFGAVNNTLAVEYRFKVDGGSWSAWTPLSSSISGSTYNASSSISGLDYRTTYVIQARAIDKINVGAITTEEKKVKSITVFDWSSDDFNFNVPVNIDGNLTANDVLTSDGTKLSYAIQGSSNTFNSLDEFVSYVGSKPYYTSMGRWKLDSSFSPKGQTTWYRGFAMLQNPPTNTSYGISGNALCGYGSGELYYGELNSDVAGANASAKWYRIPLTTSTMSDYVVAQGTSGIWTYRKWNSGIAECSCRHWFNPSSWAGNISNVLFYCYDSIALPFTLSTTYVAQAVVGAGGYITWASASVGSGSISSVSALIMQYGNSNFAGMYVDYFIQGKWK